MTKKKENSGNKFISTGPPKFQIGKNGGGLLVLNEPTRPLIGGVHENRPHSRIVGITSYTIHRSSPRISDRKNFIHYPPVVPQNFRSEKMVEERLRTREKGGTNVFPYPPPDITNGK